MSLRTSPQTGVAIRILLAPTLGELSAKLTEREKGSLPKRGAQGPHPSRLCRATFPGGEGFGERIATPSCGMVRIDMFFRKHIPKKKNPAGSPRGVGWV